ncbi:MAG: class I SAM-dependent methyltransferase [Thermoanaerobaculia bacterium]
MSSISDETWLLANLHPAQGSAELGIQIPELPPGEIQLRFTGREGRVNLQQAFDFYKFVLAHFPQERNGKLRLIDFGGGWGRILRLFLREFQADQLVLIDCLTAAIDCARSLNPPFTVVKNEVMPPLPLEPACTDACYAFSVFSHLSELACSRWLTHLRGLLVPGGRLIITTRGSVQIGNLRHLRAVASPDDADPTHPIARSLPHPDEIEQRYDAGEFQFYPTGGGRGELTSDFYGEAWIPEQWIARNLDRLGFSGYEFFTEFLTVDQCVFVLTR